MICHPYQRTAISSTVPSPSIYFCDTIALNSGEYFDLGMKNTSKVTDFYILSVYFKGIISIVSYSDVSIPVPDICVLGTSILSTLVL